MHWATEQAFLQLLCNQYTALFYVWLMHLKGRQSHVNGFVGCPARANSYASSSFPEKEYLILLFDSLFSCD